MASKTDRHVSRKAETTTTHSSGKDCSSYGTDSQSSSSHDAVREYYLSLIKEEYNRLCIVELSEKLENINEKLEKYIW